MYSSDVNVRVYAEGIAGYIAQLSCHLVSGIRIFPNHPGSPTVIPPATYCVTSTAPAHSLHSYTTMPSRGDELLAKAEKKGSSSVGWFGSSSTKWEEAGDLFQQVRHLYNAKRREEQLTSRRLMHTKLSRGGMSPDRRLNG